ncbi:hypothetical protein CABS01_01827 [Colletotrichum abscissum]|uniref:Secreted protein n=1 Tax=Colletotrichum lupini TaxID=145971 RepID=A0A9Q8SYL4_9PEZI|nr:uncharacterized protein CLUP02_10518 [Colletotrichum lupini]XP_060398395.1 uncharacterized protein CABS01_01827 [Colletotrichum abscissum]KAK1496020.1 hypothetical protein CABS01_01827 [Colletotrichum abscissum]UQC85022.1 hypothetical protein CLUP02_10518 [Colletotrichum lupini]
MSGFLFAGCSAAAAAVPVHPAALSPSSTLHPAACLALHTIEKSLSSFVIHNARSLFFCDPCATPDRHPW